MEIGLIVFIGGIFSGLIALSEGAVLCTAYLLVEAGIKEIPLRALQISCLRAWES